MKNIVTLLATLLLIISTAYNAYAAPRSLPYINVYPITNAFTEKQLSGLKPDDLCKVRNAIYARHGRSFNDAALQRFFNTQSWYHKDAKYSDKRLTAMDKRNAAFITKYEKLKFGRNAASPNSSYEVMQAMKDFTNLSTRQRAQHFLSLVSKKNGLQIANPSSYTDVHTTKYSRRTISYIELSHDFKAKRGWYEVLFNKNWYATSEDGGIASPLIKENFRRWVYVGANTFEPDISDHRDFNFIKWYKEGNKWIIAEIAYYMS